LPSPVDVLSRVSVGMSTRIGWSTWLSGWGWATHEPLCGLEHNGGGSSWENSSAAEAGDPGAIVSTVAETTRSSAASTDRRAGGVVVDTDTGWPHSVRQPSDDSAGSAAAPRDLG